MNHAEAPAPGTILADKYRVVRVIGVGGMGLVLEAEHLKLNRKVALKVLLPQVRSSGDVTARFEREARAAVRLTSPHVARVLDVDELEDGSPFLVMELLEGVGVDEEIARRKVLPPGEAVGIVLDVCSAMAEAHELGVIHRDLKPSNLFLADVNGRRVVKVLDFGISKVKDDVSASMTSTASAFGTPLYMSPEQVRSAKHVDGRTDIWSLGVVLYEMLSGELPFDAPSATGILAAIAADAPTQLKTLRPDLPSGLMTAVMQALEKDPARRYPNVRAFAAALEPFRNVSPATLTGITTLAPPRSVAGKRALFATAVLVGAIVVGAVGARLARGRVATTAPSTDERASVAAPSPAPEAPAVLATTERAAPTQAPSAEPEVSPTVAPSATARTTAAITPHRSTAPPPHEHASPKAAPPAGNPPPPSKDDPSHL